MKNIDTLIRSLFLMSIMILSTINLTNVNAHADPIDFQVLSPGNVKNLQLITSIGQGSYSGEFVLQPEGDLIAVAAASGIVLINRNNGKQTGFIPIGFQTTALAISPDGGTLAAVYNVPTGKMMVHSMMNGPEYQRRIGIYSLPDGNLIGNEIKDLQECGRSNIWQIAFLPGGDSLVFEKKYGDPADQKMFCILSTTSGKITNTLDIPSPSYVDSTISPDGKYVALVPHDRDELAEKAVILDTPTFTPLANISFPAVKFPDISFTRQGVFVVRYYEDQNEESPHTVRFWSLPDGNPLLTLEEQERYSTPAYPGIQQTQPYDRIMSEDISPDGQWVATGSQNGKVKLWDAKTGKFEKELDVLSWTSHSLIANPNGDLSSEINSYVNPLAFSSDGSTLVAAENLTTLGQSGQIHVYQMPDGKEKAVFKGEAVGSDNIGMAFSPDSSKIVFGGFTDGSAEVYNVLDGRLVLRLTGHTGLVNQARFSMDGKWIATSSDDHTINLWEANNGKLVRILNGHTARVNQIAFSPDSKWLVSGADDNTIRRWKVEDGSPVQTLTLGDGNWRFEFFNVLADQYSVVYTAMKYPSPLIGYETRQMLWNAESGKETPIGGGKVTITAMGKDGVTFMGYDEHGRIIGNLDSNGTMTLIATAIRSSYGNGALSGMTVTPDNRLLFSGNGFGLHAWELAGNSASFLGLLASGEPIPAYGQLYEMSPDGKILAFAGGGVVYLMGVPLS